MRNILIVKAGQDIYVDNRAAKDKTDMQSAEIMAFVKALNDIHDVKYNYNLILGCTAKTAKLNNDSANSHGTHSIDITQPDIVQKYTKDDVLFVFCGLWLDNEITDSIKTLMAEWPGKIFYIYNDLRLKLHPSLVDLSNLKIVTQAFFEEGYKRINLDMLPMFMQAKSTATYTPIFDISFPFVKVSDFGHYRHLKVDELSKNPNVSKLFIGPKDNFENELPDAKNSYCMGVVKNTKLIGALCHAKATYIVNEQIYIDHRLMPNRVVEAVLAGVGIIVDYKTFSSFDGPLREILIDYVVFNKHPETLTEQDVNAAYNLMKRNQSKIINDFNQRTYEFLSQLKTLITTNSL